MDYEAEERKILEEKPYNPMKHFLFEVPELLHFFIKLAMIWGFGYIAIIAMLQTVIEHAPEFCQFVK
jgi:hypothetical protein